MAAVVATDRIDEYVLDARRMTAEEFAAKHFHPFLVIEEGDEEGDQEWSFRTQTVSDTRFELAQTLAREHLTLAPELLHSRVLPLVKADDTPWKERISMGRAANNDIVLRDSSISKLHAHLEVDERGAGIARISDAGSRNGTKVNGASVREGEAIALGSKDRVTIGRVIMTVLSAGDFYQLLRRSLRADNR